MSKPKVYIQRMGSLYRRFLSEESEKLLRSFAEVVSDGERDTPMTSAELVERIRGCSVILSLSGGGAHAITGDVLKAAGTIKLICIAHWCEQLVPAAKQCGITVTEGSNANTVAVAEWTLAAALMGVRRLQEFDKAMKCNSPWGESSYGAGMLCGSTVGLIGLGRVGWYCARYFKVMGAKVIAYDKYWTQERADKLGVRLVSLDELMKSADVISLHLPVTPETTGMLDAREFSLIKDGAVFINSARAALYNEEALVDELQKKRFSAFIDVFAKEPLSPNHPLRSMENVFITPHIAGDNIVMSLRCGYDAVVTLKEYFSDKGLRNLQYSFLNDREL